MLPDKIRPASGISLEIKESFAMLSYPNFQMLSGSPTMMSKIRLTKLNVQKIWLNWETIHAHNYSKSC